MIDPRAWLTWALTALAIASSTRSPLYLLLLLLTITAVGAFVPPADERRLPFSPLRFALFAIPLAAMFNALTAHLGDTVLLHLPDWLPLVGGAVTMEGLLYGATNGLALAAILSAFAVVNQATPLHELLRLTPRAYHEAGVVLSIALTFIPQTTRSVARIREAQAVRGHRVRGLRGWLPILVPLLINGLERSMGLAEAMIARGYGATTDRAQPTSLRLLLTFGLLALLGGWLAWLFVPQAGGLAAIGLAGGAALLIGALWLAGRAVRRTAYRSHRWTPVDSLVILGCAVALTPILLPLPLVDRTALAYSPYPRLSLPPFDPLTGVAMLSLLLPLLGSQRPDPERQT